MYIRSCKLYHGIVPALIAAGEQKGAAGGAPSAIRISTSASGEPRQFVNSTISKFMLVYSTKKKKNSEPAAAVGNGYHRSLSVFL